ncbi:fh1 fh2 domain-containing protein 3 [Limosa lapponica baueri]|uniref:Fh1 fh2 domain-containing protein 3 n=1 Tax=Limosa lapponica baueri TaxID=1758121 RepID=A0A2I0UJ96_LIMLA|nr:fh1 fh2 domain-containing protein 3 [Limosa lapponica baueri]
MVIISFPELKTVGTLALHFADSFLYRMPLTGVLSEGKSKDWENEKLPTVGEDQVRDLPRNLKVHRSMRPDPQALRELVDEVVKPLSIIFEKSWKSNPDPHGGLYHPDICWRDNTAEHKKSRKFLECVNDNRLQIVEEPMRRGAMLDLDLTNKKELVRNVKLKGSLGCSDHEMVKLKILRVARKVCSKLTTLGFRRADFGLLQAQ